MVSLCTRAYRAVWNAVTRCEFPLFPRAVVGEQCEALEGRVLLSGLNFDDVAAPEYGVGWPPEAIAVGDINGDGIPDVAVLTKAPGSPTAAYEALLGDANGSYRITSLVAGTFVGATIPPLLDLNGDGTLDLLSQTTAYINDGHGGFRAGKSSGSLSEPSTIADLNGDGWDDMVGLPWLMALSTKDGNFGPTVEYSAGTRPRATAVADVDGDGHPDIVAVGYLADNLHFPGQDGFVSTLHNRGDGTFDPAVTTSIGGAPNAVKLADVNGDGHLDVVMTDAVRSVMIVMKNDGTGRLSDPILYPVGGGPSDIDAADINGDGLVEIVVANKNAHAVTVFDNQGDGAFAYGTSYTVGVGPVAVRCVDLNDDGRLEIVTANSEQLDASGGQDIASASPGQLRVT